MGNESDHKTVAEEGVAALLEALRSPDRDAAWNDFLERYSAQILRVVGQRGLGAQATDDCFLFVCECLSDDEFGRLQTFDPARGVPFRGWLSAVTANLCVEWHRREFGRERIPPAIGQMPALDQRVFHLRYQQNLAIGSCFELLIDEFPELTRESLSQALARVQNTLSWRQRWSLLRGRGRQRPLAGAEHTVMNLPERRPDPERLALIEERRDRLRLALDRLSPEDRLLLKLRYGQGLSLAQCARIAGLSNLHMARRRIESALERLGEVYRSGEAP